MPKPAIDFDTYLKRIPSHSVPLPPESEIPAAHYNRSANDAWNVLVYIERNLAQIDVYREPYDRHMRRLSTMVLLTLVEAFERFLKELAAACTNQVALCVYDDRLDVFSAKGNSVAAHFSGANVGKALCEPLAWCDCDETNKRFRRILADPFDSGNFYVFPSPQQQPFELRDRYDLMCLIWQLRHTIAHYMGVVTASDALKIRLLTKTDIQSPRLLWPTRADVWYVKLFLDESVDLINRNVGSRLANLLTTLFQANSSLFDPEAKAQELANTFRMSCTLDGNTRNPI